jgi:DNA topoisomerase, type IA, zn finger domain protein
MSAILKRKGDYNNLIAYKKSVIIYDITFFFTQHFLQKGDRTIDQMLQAARSGKQNIAEGNRAAATSTETEIKLTNVAKASLEELLIDYQDYLRTRHKLLWDTSNPHYEKMRAYAASELIFDQYHSLLHKYNDEALANLCITLIHQTSFLLYRLLEKQEKNFLKEGGIKERMYQARLNVRNK